MALALQPSPKTLSAQPQAPHRPTTRANQPSRYLQLGAQRKLEPDARGTARVDAPATRGLVHEVEPVAVVDAGGIALPGDEPAPGVRDVDAHGVSGDARGQRDGSLRWPR